MSLRLENVTHRFGGQAALSDVSLQVERGDCYGFIGHNGAGKTTAMRIVLGLLRPGEGRVVVDGFDAAAHPREARVRMGALVETPGFWGHWSGERNLRLYDRLAGTRSDTASLMDLVGLSDVADKPVRAYSQGMRQRLGVALALLGEPDYILLDEPTNGLDPDGIREMRELFLRLTREEQRTIFISSHQLHELAGLCNRVGVLRNGVLVLEERLETLLAADCYELKTSVEEHARAVLRDLGLKADAALAVDLGGRAPAAVVRKLVEAGVEVESFAPKPPTLEEIYHREAHPVKKPAPIETRPPSESRAPRRAVARLLHHEWERWTGQLMVPLVLALPVVVGVVAMLTRRRRLLDDQEEIGAGTLISATDVNAFAGVAWSLRYGLWLLSYVILGLASQSIAGEYSQGTLRNVLLRPLTRLQVVCGKWLALLGATLAAYVVLAGISIAVASWAFDFTGVTEILPNGKRFEHVGADEIWPDFKTALLSPLLPLMAYACIGFCAGAIMRRGSTAFAFALGLGFCLDLGCDFARRTPAEAWFPPAHLPGLGSTSFIDHFLKVAQGFANPGFTFVDMQVYVPLVWIGVCFVLAAAVFSRRYVP